MFVSRALQQLFPFLRERGSKGGIFVVFIISMFLFENRVKGAYNSLKHEFGKTLFHFFCF